MFLVSVAVFLITESSPGNVARNVLGAFVTPEQEASFLAQMGLDKPIYRQGFCKSFPGYGQFFFRKKRCKIKIQGFLIVFHNIYALWWDDENEYAPHKEPHDH